MNVLVILFYATITRFKHNFFSLHSIALVGLIKSTAWSTMLMQFRISNECSQAKQWTMTVTLHRLWSWSVWIAVHWSSQNSYVKICIFRTERQMHVIRINVTDVMLNIHEITKSFWLHQCGDCTAVALIMAANAHYLIICNFMIEVRYDLFPVYWHTNDIKCS